MPKLKKNFMLEFSYIFGKKLKFTQKFEKFLKKKQDKK